MLDPMMEQLLPGFVDESKEIVDRVTEHLIELEKARDEPRFDDLARGLHTLKGSAATLGLAELSELAHRMEDAVLPLRKKPVALPGALTDALLKALDIWMQHLRATAAKSKLPDLSPSKELLDSVRRAMETVDSGKSASNAPARPRREPKRERRERAREPEEASTAPTSADATSSGDDAASWRVRTREVAALLHEVERLREVRLRVEERRRELGRAVQQLSSLGILAETAGSRALLMGVQRGNMLFVEVSDDGNGLDLAAIKQAARELSIAAAAELDAMTPAQLHQLIFRNGFSTRRTVTEVSGRGVGMDVVRSQIQALQGHIEVQSTPGQGTRFSLTLPAELGSSPVLVVRCGEHELGIPMPAVETSLLARSGELRVARTRVQLSHREQLIPVQDLGALLALRQSEVPHDGQPLLVLQSQGRRIALAIDDVVGDRELVIRPLPPEVRDLAAYQGAATLARGELVLIVRPDWLSSFEKRDASLTGTRRALVVDDSLTARALHRTALESGGYSVHTASSGRQALEQLRHSSYDVMVSDIGMDEMDGFELTLEARRRHELEAMPIILVSARDSDADRQRGAASGADGFLSKKDCASGRLLAEVHAVIARRQGTA